MSSPDRENEEPSSSMSPADEGPGGSGDSSKGVRPPAKRKLSSAATAVIEISDTESDDSDVCAVNSYQASADEVKRIRRAEYSSSSSSSEYSSESEEPWEDDSIVIEDKMPSVKVVRAQLNPRANRMDDPLFNCNIKSQELIDRLSINWKENKDYKCGEVTLTCEPFRLCLVNKFLSNSDIINNIVDDMNTLDWSRKKMDLFEFHQTADLASLTWQRSIRGIYELLKTDVMSWVSQITGLDLRSVSASCSLYGPGDHLLVHDDRLSDRRVAFILYLAPWTKPHGALENGAGEHHNDTSPEEWCGWTRRMGGALQQLSHDEEGRPTEVVRSVYPRNNMFAFFQVGHHTYHQVEEVLSMELPRLSINGWYHGPEPPEPPEPPQPPGGDPAPAPASLPPPPDPVRPHSDIVVLSQWLQGSYMSPRNRLQIQAQMERDSEVCLRDLLPEPKLQELLDALQNTDVPWEWCGPANQRHYEIIPDEWAQSQPEDHVLRAVLSLFSSSAFIRALGDCTDLALTSYSRLQLQRWRRGSYSLLPPREHYSSPRLEAVLSLGNCSAGGVTTYIAPDDSEDNTALVSIPPVHNALSLVYCDPGAAAFTKYVSRLPSSTERPFYLLTCTYHE